MTTIARCGHSACVQNYIETGEPFCLRDAQIDDRFFASLYPVPAGSNRNIDPPVPGAVRVRGIDGNEIRDAGWLMPQVSEVDSRREAYRQRLIKVGAKL